MNPLPDYLTAETPFVPTSGNNDYPALARQICAYIDGAITDGSPSLEKIGAHVGMSASHVQRVFKRVMGISPREYADARRLKRVKGELRQTSAVNVADALYDAGYGSSSRLYERSDAQLGMTPRAYRDGGAGMDIHYTLTDSPLGRLMVAMTARGVCAVSLGDNDDCLEAFLHQEYPAASITRDMGELHAWVREILDYLRGWQPDIALPVDVRATAFQWRVWQALREIPTGETRSYTAIARAIGKPTAARAVARACATNPVALVVPCHRVVREDGGLSGYRWGVERKAELLAQEQQTNQTPHPLTPSPT